MLPRLLIVSPYSIDPPIHGGAVRLRNLIAQVAESLEIYVLVFVGGTDDPQQRRALAPWCRRVFFQQLPEGQGERPDLPPEAAEFASPRVAERLEALVSGHGIDVVWLDYTEMGQYAHACGEARVVLVEIDIWFRSVQRRDSLGFFDRYGGRGGQRLAQLRRSYELEACKAVDQIHVMSEEDRDFLAGEIGSAADKIWVIPNGVDTKRYRPAGKFSERRELLFLGSFPHLPNLDALDFFLAEVWPQVRAVRPATTLTIAGARPPQRVLDLDGRDGLRVVGEVSDVVPLYQGHRALVAPIRAGSGTRLKILEAFASGLPVVSTTLGAEGLGARDGEELLLADGPADLAAACLRVLDEDPLAERLAAGGRRLAEESFSWTAVGASARRALLELVPGDSRVPRVSEKDGPEVDVSVILAGGGDVLEESVVAVRRQELEASVEILWPVAAPTAVERETAEGLGIRPVEIALGVQRASGEALNAAARRSRGGVLVFLGAATLPLDATWLHQLTAPFFFPASPAAVVGGTVESLPGGVRLARLDFTAEARRWRERFEGVSFSLANGAIRRDLWEAFPFRPGEGLEDLRWQRQMVAAGQLILPCLGALVERRHAGSPRTLLRRFLAEGRAWRRLGVRYRTGEALGDLMRPRAYDRGWRSSVGLLLRRRIVAAALPWLRVCGVFWGNRLQPRARTSSAQGFTTPASGPGE